MLKNNTKIKNKINNDLENEIYNSVNISNKLEINIEEDKKNINVDNGFKNNNVWIHIFKEIKYDGKNDIIITATQIKNCKKTWNGNNCQFEPPTKL